MAAADSHSACKTSQVSEMTEEDSWVICLTDLEERETEERETGFQTSARIPFFAFVVFINGVQMDDKRASNLQPCLRAISQTLREHLQKVFAKVFVRPHVSVETPLHGKVPSNQDPDDIDNSNRYKNNEVSSLLLSASPAMTVLDDEWVIVPYNDGVKVKKDAKPHTRPYPYGHHSIHVEFTGNKTTSPPSRHSRSVWPNLINIALKLSKYTNSMITHMKLTMTFDFCATWNEYLVCVKKDPQLALQLLTSNLDHFTQMRIDQPQFFEYLNNKFRCEEQFEHICQQEYAWLQKEIISVLINMSSYGLQNVLDEHNRARTPFDVLVYLEQNPFCLAWIQCEHPKVFDLIKSVCPQYNLAYHVGLEQDSSEWLDVTQCL